MIDDIESWRPVEWFRDLFDGITAGGLYSWLLVAWAVFAAAMVALDRLGAGLLGRSRPLTQPPPSTARTWRWRHHDAPVDFSRLTTSTVNPRSIRRVRATIPTSTPITPEPLPLPPAPPTMLPSDSLADGDFWRAATDPGRPLFGVENTARLEQGLPPQRYNPLVGRVEELERDHLGRLSWPSEVGPLESLTDDEE